MVNPPLGKTSYPGLRGGALEKPCGNSDAVPLGWWPNGIAVVPFGAFRLNSMRTHAQETGRTWIKISLRHSIYVLVLSVSGHHKIATMTTAKPLTSHVGAAPFVVRAESAGPGLSSRVRSSGASASVQRHGVRGGGWKSMSRRSY